MKHVKLEVCCGSVADAILAQRAGADRIELNAALELGGLTPSPALFEMTRRCVRLPIMVMIRPHNGGYDYSDLDFEVMRKDAQFMLERGADGIVFGFLTSDGLIDEARVKLMVTLAQAKDTVFHKAIDEIADLEAALAVLIRCGVTRVLIGGGQGSIESHLELIGKLQAQYGNQIELLPGGGISLTNLTRVLKVTGADQIHMTCKRIETHPLTKVQHAIVDETTLATVIETLNQQP